jgi:hypothetical protein
MSYVPTECAGEDCPTCAGTCSLDDSGPEKR